MKTLKSFTTTIVKIIKNITYPVGKMAKNAVCRSVFLTTLYFECWINKNAPLRLFFFTWFCPLGIKEITLLLGKPILESKESSIPYWTKQCRTKVTKFLSGIVLSDKVIDSHKNVANRSFFVKILLKNDRTQISISSPYSLFIFDFNLGCLKLPMEGILDFT